MKSNISKELSKITELDESKILPLLETPPNPDLGDLAFPCFSLSKILKKAPNQIAQDLSKKIPKIDGISKVSAEGPYVNFFIDKSQLAQNTLSQILKQKDKFGSSPEGKGKTIVLDLSSPNIAKPFGIGHLRSTLIGSSIANICNCLGYKTVRINHLGDWGTQFGKLIVGFQKFGSEKKLEQDPIKHLLDIYVKVNGNPDLEQESRDWFKKLEAKDPEAMKLWEKFRELSLEDFKKIYNLLGIKFDSYAGEAFYNDKMEPVVKELKEKSLLEESDGAQIVNLEKYKLGVSLIQKSDGATLYTTRDLAAAIYRAKKYKFHKMIYEVGAEQKLHFNQFFKILDLMGYKWAKDCIHVDHGFYLGKDGKKFATRKGHTIFMEDIIKDTISLAEKSITSRESNISKKETKTRAHAIAIAAIIYGDLKNHRSKDSVFDIQKFLSFEGDTGPYLLYTYARSRSILRKAKYKSSKPKIPEDLNAQEIKLITKLSQFPQIVQQAYQNLAPNNIANYAFQLSQIFNEFYHASPVIGSESEQFRLTLVDAFSQVLKNALSLLGIQTLEKM